MIQIIADKKSRAVFAKLIQTIGKDVEWNGMFFIAAGNLILPGKVRSLLFQVDQRKLRSYVMEVPTENSNAEESEGNDVLANALNMILYAFGKWNMIPGLKVEKDYKALGKLFNDILCEIGIQAQFSEDSLKFIRSDHAVAYEEVIRCALDWWSKEEQSNEKLEEVPVLGLWHNLCWETDTGIFQKSPSSNVQDPKNSELLRIGHNFYPVDYQCPVCKTGLHMVVFPVDREVLIETQEGKVYLARAYTCNICHKFHTPRPGKLLSEGDIYTFTFEDDINAYEDYLNLLGEAGDRCSNYKFNEYALDRKNKKEQAKDSLKDAFEKRETLSKEELTQILDKTDSGCYDPDEVAKYKDTLEIELKRKQKMLPHTDSNSKETKLMSMKEPIAEQNIPQDQASSVTVHGISESSEKSHTDKKQGSNPEGRAASKGILTSEEAADLRGTPLSAKSISPSETLTSKQTTALEDTPSSQKVMPLSDSQSGENSIQEEMQLINKKVKSCQGKSYHQIGIVLDEIKEMLVPEENKSRVLFSLMQYRGKQARKEAQAILSAVPAYIGKKEHESLREKLTPYDEEDIKPFLMMLEERFDHSEKQEIQELIKKARKKDRSELFALYEDLKNRDFRAHNKEPFITPIYDKIYEMDQIEIDKLCPDPLRMTFQQGLESYRNIAAGIFLPGLKKNTLEMLDKRLTKMRSDENGQLVKKLKKEIERSINDRSRLYFYDVRGIAHDETDEKETAMMQKAMRCFGGELIPYEYPILIGDSSYLRNAKEGIILTPDHLIFKTLFQSGKLGIEEIENFSEPESKFQKGIMLCFSDGSKKKIPGVVKKEERKKWLDTMNDFLAYLQEKPESRKLSYLAKEKHDIKCCLRCGYTYKDEGACPKCGSKANQ